MNTATTTASWQEALKRAIKDPYELARYLQLPAHFNQQVLTSCADFSLRVPLPFVRRMQKGNPQDPLLLQVLPQAQEQDIITGYSKDPINESQYTPVPGLLHKYHSRVLLTLTGSCAINCRYCFRRHFPYQQHQPLTIHWPAIANYIQHNNSINEVILSGGDPLMLKDDVLARCVNRLKSIKHLRRLRIHTRLPIVIPQRITPELLHLLDSSHLQNIIVTHCNHPNEIDAEVKKQLQLLTQHKVTLLNQTVLLKGINDNAADLIQLSETLFDAGVLPYYLHCLDKVAGSAHFDISEPEAKLLHQQMKSQLPGFLVPKLVREIPSETSKTWL